LHQTRNLEEGEEEEEDEEEDEEEEDEDEGGLGWIRRARGGKES